MASAPTTEEISSDTATPADESSALEWIVEILSRTGKEKWSPAADFKKHGKLAPVTCEKAIQVVKLRQRIANSDFNRDQRWVYRIRNIRTDAVLMGAVL